MTCAGAGREAPPKERTAWLIGARSSGTSFVAQVTGLGAFPVGAYWRVGVLTVRHRLSACGVSACLAALCLAATVSEGQEKQAAVPPEQAAASEKLCCYWRGVP